MQLSRLSGSLLTATGVLHVVAAAFMKWNDLSAIVRSGVVDSIAGDAPKALAFWFLMVGVFVILLGIVLQRYIDALRQPAPISLGWALLVVAVIGCVVVPVSGFWLFLPQAAIIIWAKR